MVHQERTTTLFEADPSGLGHDGLSVEDETIKAGDDGCITLAVQIINYGSEPVYLDEGKVLG